MFHKRFADAGRGILRSTPERGDVWSGTQDRRGGMTAPESFSTGVSAGTLIATNTGWRPVETIRRGDRVLTFDSGLQEVTHVHSGMLLTKGQDCPKHLLPLGVPAKALGNRKPMLLLPDQVVLVESDTAEELYGDPFALVPAGRLAGYRGIAPVVPRSELGVITLGFERDEIVYANGSALLHFRTRAPMRAGDTRAQMHPSGPRNPYLKLSRDSLVKLVDRLKDEDRRRAAQGHAARANATTQAASERAL